jgi:sporulation protein YlmC with PRC-barrel domain
MNVHAAKRTLFATAGCLALAGPALAATPGVTTDSARQCLTDLSAFESGVQKDGYWIEGSGYGYPVYGYGFSYGDRYGDSAGYGHARPGYEVRTLLSAARILAQRGEQLPCEAVLSATRAAYTTYLAELRRGQLPLADVPTWRRQEIESAVPVSSDGVGYRSDLLIGESVVNGKDENLGSVEDIVFSPKTGKIAYLVIGHGGFWGIDEKYSPVPWTDFKSVTGNNLLVLTVPKTSFDSSPLVLKDDINGAKGFAAQTDKVDSYWSAHPPVAMN